MTKQAKQIAVKFGIGIILLLILFFYNSKTNAKENKIETDYYEKTNLKFKGIVKKIKPLMDYQHDYGVISIDLYQSNQGYYDPRDSLDRFLGVIKNSKVDLVFNQISRIQVGDSIDFDVQEFKLYRNGKLVRKSVVGIPPDDMFKPFREINENIEL